LAYGKKYTITFANRIQNDIYRVEIWQKDFADDSTELTGAEVPFTVNWQEVEILSPIKALEFTLNFITDGSIGIEDFYSDDDEGFRMDFYFQSDSSGGGTEKLLHSGYLIQDGASEPVTDIKHTITLKATDNLALLKSIKWNEATGDYFGHHPLGYYFRYCLKQTGLYSNDVLLSPNMPLRLFGNLFENTTDDRADDPLADPYAETVVHSSIFQNDNSTWIDCYSVLEQILTDMNACIVQADGCWNILRTTEYSLFTDGQILGTQYVYNGVGTDVDEVTLEPLVTIAKTGGDCYPIQEDQSKSMQRPYKYVLNTFNYNQPNTFIIQQDLQIPIDAVPYDTETIGDLRYDRYDLVTYFPDWIQRGGDASYLEVVTNIAVDPEDEVERYIITPGADAIRGVQFNPIAFTAGDRFDFNIQYRTLTDTDNVLDFGVRFVLITATTTYTLISVPSPYTGLEVNFYWDENPTTEWDSMNGIAAFISDSEADNIDTTEYLTYSLSGFLEKPKIIPSIPEDGMLLIQIMGTNADLDPDPSPHTTTVWKDIVLTVKQFINDSIQITAQTHTDTGASTIKATNESTLNIDDSPRNTIGGTLFTDELTSFEYTDTGSGESTDIGNIYFTRTRTWHRDGISEVLRLGNVITQERLALRYISRLILEGSFRNLRYDTDKFISLLSLFQISFYPGKSFLPAGMEINYMNCSFRSKLVEVFNDDDAVMTSVFMAGEKEEELSITTDVIHFDTITNFGGADAYIAVTNTNSTFTYINAFDTTVDLSVIFYVPISGSGTATFTLEKNGGVIATQTLNALAHFGYINFDLTESVTDTDYFEVFVDTGGANVDIQSGSINITVNGVQSLVNFPYQFRYLYKTD
jgi:hypothetical protein